MNVGKLDTYLLSIVHTRSVRAGGWRIGIALACIEVDNTLTEFLQNGLPFGVLCDGIINSAIPRALNSDIRASVVFLLGVAHAAPNTTERTSQNGGVHLDLVLSQGLCHCVSEALEIIAAVGLRTKHKQYFDGIQKGTYVGPRTKWWLKLRSNKGEWTCGTLMGCHSQWQAAEMARVQERGPLVVVLKIYELYEHFQLAAATLLKEKPEERQIEPTFDLQITVLVGLRHTITKVVLSRGI